MRKKKAATSPRRDADTVASVDNNADSQEQSQATLSLYSSFISRLRVLEVQELDNTKGSVARDHLANERTFLAWLRTSLSFSSAYVYLSRRF